MAIRVFPIFLALCTPLLDCRTLSTLEQTIFQSLVSNLSVVLDEIQNKIQQRDELHCDGRCSASRPVLVSRPVSGSSVATHYGVCHKCVVVDLNLRSETSSGVGWQTASSVASAIVGAVSLSGEVGFQASARQAVDKYDRRVAEILFDVYKEVGSIVAGEADDKFTQFRTGLLDTCSMPRNEKGLFTKGHNRIIKRYVKLLAKAFGGRRWYNALRVPFLTSVDAAASKASETLLGVLLSSDIGASWFFDIASTPSMDFNSAMDYSILPGVEIIAKLISPQLAAHFWFINMLWANIKAGTELQTEYNILMDSLRSIGRWRIGSAAILGGLASIIVGAGAYNGSGDGIVGIQSLQQFACGHNYSAMHEVKEQCEFEVNFTSPAHLSSTQLITHRLCSSLGDVECELTTCNCEHFANWALTGVPHSTQAHRASSGLGGIGSSGIHVWLAAILGIGTIYFPARVFGFEWLATVLPSLVPLFGTPAAVIPAPVSVLGFGSISALGAIAGWFFGGIVNTVQTMSPNGALGKFEQTLTSWNRRNMSNASIESALLRNTGCTYDEQCTMTIWEHNNREGKSQRFTLGVHQSAQHYRNVSNNVVSSIEVKGRTDCRATLFQHNAKDSGLPVPFKPGFYTAADIEKEAGGKIDDATAAMVWLMRY